jgi:hypothetical protein
MRYWLITIEHKEGEHEYHHYGIVTAPNHVQAMKTAEANMVDWFAYPDEVAFGDSEYSLRVRGVQEITAEDYATLKRLGVATDMQDSPPENPADDDDDDEEEQPAL